MKLPGIFGSRLIDLTIVAMVVMKASGLLSWPWWRVTFPVWGSLAFLFCGALAFRVLRVFVRALWRG